MDYSAGQGQYGQYGHAQPQQPHGYVQNQPVAPYAAQHSSYVQQPSTHTQHQYPQQYHHQQQQYQQPHQHQYQHQYQQSQQQNSVGYSAPHTPYANVTAQPPHQNTYMPSQQPQLHHSHSYSGPHQHSYPSSPNLQPPVSPNMQGSMNTAPPVSPNLLPPSPIPSSASPSGSPLLTPPLPQPSGIRPPNGSYTPFQPSAPLNGSYTPFTGGSPGTTNTGGTVHVDYIPTTGTYKPYRPLPGGAAVARDAGARPSGDMKGLPASIPKLQPLSEPLEVVPGYWVDQQVTLVLKETFDNFTVVDIDKQPVLEVKSRMSVSRKKVFYDTYGNIVFNLKGRKHQFTGTDESKREILKVSSPALKFDTRLEASVVNALTHRTETLTVTGEWPGDIVEIKWKGAVIAVIIRKLGVRDFFGQNTYIVTIAPGADLVAMAALCICVDERREAT